VRPDNRINKAVSDGAISFFLDHYVCTRVSKVSYGTLTILPYNTLDPEHVKRFASTFLHVDGLRYTGDAFRMVLPKNTQVFGTKEFTQTLYMEAEVDDTTLLLRHKVSVLCYRGSQINPIWADTEPANFTKLCDLEVDLSQIPKSVIRLSARRTYYSSECDLVLIFGLTELRAQVRWLGEDGVERRSPAQLIYDDI